MNILLDGFVCPNCFNKIDNENNGDVNKAFTYDNAKDELYCNKCGMVLKDSTIPTLKTLEYLAIRTTEFESTELYKTIPKNKFIDAYDLSKYLKAILKAEEEAREKERIRKREERKAKAKATREKNKKKKSKKKKKKKT